MDRSAGSHWDKSVTRDCIAAFQEETGESSETADHVEHRRSQVTLADALQ